MTAQEAGKKLGISARRILALVQQGRIKAMRIGRVHVWIEAADLDKLVRKPVGRPRNDPKYRVRDPKTDRKFPNRRRKAVSA